MLLSGLASVALRFRRNLLKMNLGKSGHKGLPCLSRSQETGGDTRMNAWWFQNDVVIQSVHIA